VRRRAGSETPPSKRCEHKLKSAKCTVRACTNADCGGQGHARARAAMTPVLSGPEITTKCSPADDTDRIMCEHCWAVGATSHIEETKQSGLLGAGARCHEFAQSRSAWSGFRQTKNCACCGGRTVTEMPK
jgi:hypothetical protein